MPGSLSCTIAMLACLAWTSALPQASPRVYSDNYLEINASVMKPGGGDQRLGEVLILQVELMFDPQEVQVEALDAEYFQRNFSATAAIREVASPESVSGKHASGKLTVKTLWPFMVLDCPVAEDNCPGVRQYLLPKLTLAYRLHTENGTAASERTARFTPWPDQLTLLSSIALPDEPNAKITEVINEGAFPLPVAAVSLPSLHWIALLAGVLLFAVGWSRRHPDPTSSLTASTIFVAERRWQQALLSLASAARPDEEFADLLRRALTWYCLDERRINPFEWLGEDPVAPQHDELHKFFLELLNTGRIEPEQRDEYLLRVWHFCSMPGRPPTTTTRNA